MEPVSQPGGHRRLAVARDRQGAAFGIYSEGAKH
jgi:hypothetical protein